MWMREYKTSNLWTSWIKAVDIQWDDGSKAFRIIYMFKQLICDEEKKLKKYL